MTDNSLCAISALIPDGSKLTPTVDDSVPQRPSNEAERLEALRGLGILDTPHEVAFDRIATLATAIFNVPAALISLVDENRQWIKACHGITLTETPRDVSFCAHTILEAEALIIPDTLEDPRFAQNPLVLGPPYIRFYAGMPLQTRSGHKVGSVCIIDFKARHDFDSSKKSLLGQLAAIATDELALRRHKEELATLVEAEAFARAKAEDAMVVKAHFIETMSHEIRTPLSGLIGMVDMLSASGLRSDQLYYAKVLKSAGDHLLRIVNEILDFSKLEAGAIEYKATVCDLADVTQNAISVVAASIERDLAVGAVIDPSVPQTVICDSLRLQQVLINLVGNGVKFTHSGGVYVEISLAAPLKDGPALIRFAVNDTGIGIPKEDHSKLFNRFSQLHPVETRNYGGTGLGLSICQHLVQLMGGQITVESELGKGSCFSFVIPLEYRTVTQSSMRPKLPVDYRVLLVEHNPIDQLIMRRHLENLGAQVTQVDDLMSLGTVIRKAEQSDAAFDALVIDNDTAARLGILQTLKTSPHIFGSAKVIHTTREYPPEDAADNCLVKPITETAILNALTMPGRVPVVKKNEPAKSTILQSTSIEVAARQKKLNILLVEDNEINRVVATAMVKNIGHDIVAVTNGIEAVSAVAAGQFDLVLMDMMMPEIDGLTATKAIRKLRGPQANVYIIALTANASTEHQQQCFAAGMSDFVTKPVTKQRLEEALGRYVELNSISKPDSM